MTERKSFFVKILIVVSVFLLTFSAPAYAVQVSNVYIYKN